MPLFGNLFGANSDVIEQPMASVQDLPKLVLRPEQSSYAVTPGSSIVETQLDGGKSRRRTDIVNSASVVDVSWFLNQSQYQYIQSFFNRATAKGATPFLIDLILSQPSLEEFEATFVADSFVLDGVQGLSFEVSAQLEVVPIRDDEFDEIFLILFDNGKEVDFLNCLEQLANIDLKVCHD